MRFHSKSSNVASNTRKSLDLSLVVFKKKKKKLLDGSEYLLNIVTNLLSWQHCVSPQVAGWLTTVLSRCLVGCQKLRCFTWCGTKKVQSDYGPKPGFVRSSKYVYLCLLQTLTFTTGVKWDLPVLDRPPSGQSRNCNKAYFLIDFSPEVRMLTLDFDLWLMNLVIFCLLLVKSGTGTQSYFKTASTVLSKHPNITGMWEM